MDEPSLPEPLRAPLHALEEQGFACWLVGRCLRELAAGTPVADFEAASAAPLDAMLRVLPRAVVSDPYGRRITVPTAAGPLELAPLGSQRIEDALARRDFTIHAMAWRPRATREPSAPAGDWRDPHGGRGDLAARRLRAPGAAKDRLAEDPLRALRALRWVSQLGFEPDAELSAALGGQAAALAKLGGPRVRVEIEGLLLGPHAERALELLRKTGLEAALAQGARPDAARVVARLPVDLELRMAAWLRGTRVRAVLRDLRCPRDRALRIERLLQLHPVDAGSAATRESRARRLLRRDARLRDRLLALRRAEVGVHADPAEERALERLVRTLAALERSQRLAERRAALRIGGREVMETLGCGPGAEVGAALHYLAEQIDEDPARNEPATLRRLLASWKSDYPPPREEDGQ